LMRVFVFMCLCFPVLEPCDELITRPRSPTIVKWSRNWEISPMLQSVEQEEEKKTIKNGSFLLVALCVDLFWINMCPLLRSQDSVGCIATGYGLDDRGAGFRVPVGARIFTSPCRSDRLWGPSSLLSNGYRRLFPRG
jgi:hypothetical protein